VGNVSANPGFAVGLGPETATGELDYRIQLLGGKPGSKGGHSSPSIGDDSNLVGYFGINLGNPTGESRSRQPLTGSTMTPRTTSRVDASTVVLDRVACDRWLGGEQEKYGPDRGGHGQDLH
jgi:hypothetical protein